MVSKKVYCILLIFFLFFLYPNCKPQPTSGTLDISLYLPASGEVDEWKKERALLSYSGEDLFTYINGGAEIYHEYGFKQVVVQDYKNANERSLSVEIFKMENPAAAYGIYSFKKSPEGKPWETAHEGRLEGYYLNFWKDHFLVTITGFDEEDETVAGIKSIAEAIANNIPEAEDVQKPQLTNILPQKDLIPGSEKYFMGSLGLFNSYPFSRQDIFDIKEGAKGSYSEGYDIYLIQYTDPHQSGEQLKGIEESLQRDPRYFGLKSSELAVIFRDDTEKLLYFTTIGKYIIIVLGAEDLTRAEYIAKGIQFNTDS